MIEEVGKYKKKRQSNTSKSKAKSNHKHIAKECLFVSDQKIVLGKYCTKCGKVLGWDLPLGPIVIGGRKYSKLLNNEEILQKHSDLEQIEVKDLLTKYIELK